MFGFRPIAKEDMLAKPFHDYVLPKEDCLSTGQSVLTLDMKTMQIEELEDLQCVFSFEIQKRELMHGFCTWFEVEFSPLVENGEMVTLNTGPEKE